MKGSWKAAGSAKAEPVSLPARSVDPDPVGAVAGDNGPGSTGRPGTGPGALIAREGHAGEVTAARAARCCPHASSQKQRSPPLPFLDLADELPGGQMPSVAVRARIDLHWLVAAGPDRTYQPWLKREGLHFASTVRESSQPIASLEGES